MSGTGGGSPTDDSITLRQFIDREWEHHAELHRILADALEVRMEEHRASHDREHGLTQVALDKAQASMDVRFESVNEFRAQLNDQAGTFARTEIMTANFKTLQDKIETSIGSLQEKIEASHKSLQENVEKLDTHLSDRILTLEKQSAITAGRSGGSAQTVVWIFAGLSALGTIITIMLHFLN